MHHAFFLSSRRAVALLLLAGLSSPALALQPLITDDTGTQGSGGNQLELSFSEERAKSDGNTDRTGTPEYYLSEKQMVDNQHGAAACMMAVSEQLRRA